jgi:hypothetical protein
MSSLTTTHQARASERPGRRGPGSKAARTRSTSEFVEGFERAAWSRSNRRVSDRDRREEKRQAEKLDGMFDRRKAELDAAYRACERGGNPTDAQRALVNQAEDAAFFLSRHIGATTAMERIKHGYKWNGGTVAGKYWQDKFVERGFRSWIHPFMKRFVASCARAHSGRLRTGPAKDACMTQGQKHSALDQPYAFFCDNCKDMFRLDIDRRFASEKDLRSRIAFIVKEHDLPCAPHVASWIFDDSDKGAVINPQLWFLLPEGHAVWNDKKQHRMLGQVAAALTKAFGGDPGGLAYLYHGKNPLSPHCGYAIIQDDVMPTLSEYAEALDLTWDPEMMARELMTQRLKDAGVDPKDSNTYFSFVRKVCNEAAKSLYKAGFDIADAQAFAKKIAEIASLTAADEINPTTQKAIEAVAKLVESCSRWSAHHFDPDMMDKTGRDRGGAAHLMSADDDATTRMRKGQAHSAGVKVRETRELLVKAMLVEMQAGREPTVQSITAIVDRSENTVRAHFFACHVTAVASAAVQDLVKGVDKLPAVIRPSQTILTLAIQSSDLPDSWRDLAIDEHFRQQALREARRQRLRPSGVRPSASIRPAGKVMLDFIAAGGVRVFRSSKPVIRSLAA